MENVSELESKGLSCCGDQCKERLPLETVKKMLDPTDRAELEARLAKAAVPTDESLAKEDVKRLIRGFEDAFILCCPTDGCGGGLDGIEGCNAAKCSNEACKATFCYLCLEGQENSQAAHAHVKEHSGDFWERRPGYVDRYQWILARKKLTHLFERKVDNGVRARALEVRQGLLKEKNMWPMPAGLMSPLWIEEVRAAHLPHDKTVEILQNEYIYRKQVKDKKNAAVVSAELKRIGAAVLASLDVKDARPDPHHQPVQNVAQNGGGGQGAVRGGGGVAQQQQHPGPDIIPVHEGDARVPAAFTALGPENMYQVGNLIWSAMVGPHDVEVEVEVRDGFLGLGRRHMERRVEHRDGKMNQHDAEAFCRNLGPRVYLPTRADYEELARAMIVNGRYDRNRIPDMSGNWFWSSSVLPAYPVHAFVFNGSNGDINSFNRSLKKSVRCGLPAL